ncbi:MAG TPA: hypothetical protein VK112_12200 [Fodinibius sp.]|nr:hypothetical protein [Fodinibius sp.]
MALVALALHKSLVYRRGAVPALRSIQASGRQATEGDKCWDDGHLEVIISAGIHSRVFGQKPSIRVYQKQSSPPLRQACSTKF